MPRPDKPTSSRQQYYLTEAGRQILDEAIKAGRSVKVTKGDFTAEVTSSEP